MIDMVPTQKISRRELMEARREAGERSPSSVWSTLPLIAVTVTAVALGVATSHVLHCDGRGAHTRLITLERAAAQRQIDVLEHVLLQEMPIQPPLFSRPGNVYFRGGVSNGANLTLPGGDIVLQTPQGEDVLRLLPDGTVLAHGRTVARDADVYREFAAWLRAARVQVDGAGSAKIGGASQLHGGGVTHGGWVRIHGGVAGD